MPTTIPVIAPDCSPLPFVEALLPASAVVELGAGVASVVERVISVYAADVERVGVERVTSVFVGSAELVGVDVKSQEVGTRAVVPMLSEICDSSNVCFEGLKAEDGYRTDKLLGAGASKVLSLVLEQSAEPSRAVEQQRHSSAWES